MHALPRAQEPHLHAERRPVEGACPERGAAELAGYCVVSEGGWWDVRKCGRCPHSVSRTPGPPYGSLTPLGLQV